MDRNEFTPRNVAKWVASSIIAMKTASLASDAITDHTRFESDDIVVKLGAGTIGWYISNKTAPYTDQIVDKAADFIVDQRTKFAAKKEDKKKEDK